MISSLEFNQFTGEGKAQLQTTIKSHQTAVIDINKHLHKPGTHATCRCEASNQPKVMYCGNSFSVNHLSQQYQTCWYLLKWEHAWRTIHNYILKLEYWYIRITRKLNLCYSLMHSLDSYRHSLILHVHLNVIVIEHTLSQQVYWELLVIVYYCFECNSFILF